MEKISLMQLFAAIAHQGSLVAAGRQHGLSASAVGKALARLEQHLGVRLIQRSTRRLSLTAEGETYLAHCERILAEIDAVERAMRYHESRLDGRIRMSLPNEGGLVTRHLAEFLQRHPDITLDLDYSDRQVDVIGEGFDLVVRGGVPRDSRLAARPLGFFCMQLYASTDYLARAGTPENASDLPRHACLHYRFPDSGKLQPWPLDIPQELPVSLCGNNTDALIRLAEQGAGITCLPDFAARQSVEQGKLVPVLPGLFGCSGRMSLLWPANPWLPPRVRALIDFLAERVFA